MKIRVLNSAEFAIYTVWLMNGRRTTSSCFKLRLHLSNAYFGATIAARPKTRWHVACEIKRGLIL